MLILQLAALVGSAVARPQNLLPSVSFQSTPAGHVAAPGQAHLSAPHLRTLINDAARFAPARPFAARSPITTVQRIYQADESGQFTSSHTDSEGSFFQESGRLVPTNDGLDRVLVKSGAYQYTSPEGTPVCVSYTADARGFHPMSSAIPVTPLSTF